MRLTIFGAKGKTGKQIVEQALSAGHQVIAFVRNPAKLDVRHENLKIVRGELTEQQKIEQAVIGSDAVLSALGPRGKSKGKPLTRVVQNIISAMKKQGVRRLIIISTRRMKTKYNL